MSPTVSILVPVYNVEDHIIKSIGSILNQSFSDFELILVNDGSQDTSGIICDAFAKEDSRIKVIHKENEGFYSARNVGLSLAQGKYIYFMDSDDWIEPDLLKDNVAIAESNNAEIVFFGHFRDWISKTQSKVNEIKPSRLHTFKGFNHKRLFEELESIIGMALWQMLIRRELVEYNNLSFPKMKREPDMSFIIDLYAYTTGVIVFNPKSYYHHIIIRSKQKLDPNIFINHKKIYEKAFSNFMKPTFAENARPYLCYLFVTWFAHSIPNGIIANKQEKIKEKLRQIKKVITDPKVSEWSGSFDINHTSGIINKVLLFLLKLQNPFAIYILITAKRFLFNKLKWDFRK